MSVGTVVDREGRGGGNNVLDLGRPIHGEPNGNLRINMEGLFVLVLVGGGGGGVYFTDLVK